MKDLAKKNNTWGIEALFNLFLNKSNACILLKSIQWIKNCSRMKITEPRNSSRFFCFLVFSDQICTCRILKFIVFIIIRTLHNFGTYFQFYKVIVQKLKYRFGFYVCWYFILWFKSFDINDARWDLDVIIWYDYNNCS